MAYSKIRQPKLSDVIEQQLEFLILEGPCAPVKTPPERELAKQFDVSPRCVRRFNASKPRACCFVVREVERLFRAACGRASAIRWLSCCPITLNPNSICLRPVTRWKASRPITRRCADEDRDRIRELHQAIERAQQSGDLDAESGAVVQYQIAVTEAAHNVVLLHLLRCMEPMLAQNVRQNFELLYARREMLPLVSNHRTRIFEAIMAGSRSRRVKRRTVTGVH